MMENKNIESTTAHSRHSRPWKIYTVNLLYVLLALLIFLFSLDLMIASLHQLGSVATESISLATSNPFTSLFIGLLITAILQSSSTTTSMVVALVASGSINLQASIPIIMGANIGTTITSTIISLGFITHKKEFRRAVTVGTYHDFFNILTTAILFPLEYYFGFLSGMATIISSFFFQHSIGTSSFDFPFLGGLFESLITVLQQVIKNGSVLIFVSIGLLFSSILFFRRVITRVLGFSSPEKIQRFFFQNASQSFGWGVLLTALIRSSTVTTSLVVPLVAKKVIKIRLAIPFILGANIGTTITAFIAAIFQSNVAIRIAIAHFLFNLIGVILFLVIPIVKDLPLRLANSLGKSTLRYRLIGFLYLLFTFFIIPFVLIFLSRNLEDGQEATYTYETSHEKTIITRSIKRNAMKQWGGFLGVKQQVNAKEIQLYRKGNEIVIDNEQWAFNKVGFCKIQQEEKKYQVCVKAILPFLRVSEKLTLDSVFVFEKRPLEPDKLGPSTIRVYVSSVQNILVKKEIFNNQGKMIRKEQLIELN